VSLFPVRTASVVVFKVERTCNRGAPMLNLDSGCGTTTCLRARLHLPAGESRPRVAMISNQVERWNG
jgi:hypothetical protein